MVLPEAVSLQAVVLPVIRPAAVDLPVIRPAAIRPAVIRLVAVVLPVIRLVAVVLPVIRLVAVVRQVTAVQRATEARPPVVLPVTVVLRLVMVLPRGPAMVRLRHRRRNPTR